MEPSKTFRMLAVTAVVSLLAILVTSPAQAMYDDAAGGGSAPAPIVANPGDPAQVASGGLDLGALTFVAIGGGALLVLLAAGAVLFTSRHRRVAMP